MDYESFIRPHFEKQSLTMIIYGMLEESGEISGVVKRIYRGDYGNGVKQFVEKNGIKQTLLKYKNCQADFINEIGDCHSYMTAIITQLGLNWDIVEARNFEKLQNRLVEKNIIGHDTEFGRESA